LVLSLRAGALPRSKTNFLIAPFHFLPLTLATGTGAPVRGVARLPAHRRPYRDEWRQARAIGVRCRCQRYGELQPLGLAASEREGEPETAEHADDKGRDERRRQALDNEAGHQQDSGRDGKATATRPRIAITLGARTKMAFIRRRSIAATSAPP
jgi:hypothetical protein